MNNPEDVPINAQDEIAWLSGYKNLKGLSWGQLAKESDIPSSTLQALLSGKYLGVVEEQAKRIFRFHQKVDSQEQRSRSALSAPKFIPTPSAKRFQFLLEVAQMGRITVAATGPGTGKTMTAQQYQASMGANCWLVTVRQSSGSLNGMISAVMDAMGLSTRQGSVRLRSDEVVKYVRDRNGLLIVDEAGHLELNSLEELRGWHDETRLGIALFGNEELLMRIRGGEKRHAYARLNSRIANSHIQDVPRKGDVDAFLDAFNVDDGAIRKKLISVALSPHNGGLREVKQILEGANMLAIAEDTAMTLSHVDDAQNARLTQHVRSAAA